MAKKTILAQMKQRRDTKANWESTNPVLLDGELGIVSDDPNLYKIGDGATAWNSLPFRGFDGTIVQETGTSINAVMSQAAVTEELEAQETKLAALESKSDNFGSIAEGVFNGIIGEFSKNGLLAYQDFYVGTVPKGIKIINNSSIPILVAENETLENRQDISAHSFVVANSNKALFRTLNVAGDVSISFVLPIADNSVTTDKIVDNSVTTDKIASEAVTPQKTSFIHSVNLVNKNDDDVLIGSYISLYGDVNTNSAYNATGFIPVKPNTTYQLVPTNNAGYTARFVCVYNQQKNVISGGGVEDATHITTNENTYFLRVTYSTSAWSFSQITEGETPIAYQDYNLELDEDITYNGEVDGSKIKKSTIPLDSLSFIHSVNLVNKNDSDVAIGKFLTSTGSLSGNSIYNTSGFIPVKPNTTYQLVASDYRHGVRCVNVYDENKVCLSQHQYLQEITTSDNVYFLRITEQTNYWPYTQVTEGESPVAYQDYALQIPGELVSKETDNNSIPFFLPKHIYVASGRTIEIYYEQILLNADRYNIQATCPIGKALERKFQIIGDDSHVGNTYTLSIYAYDDFGNVVASDNSTIHIVSSTISEGKNILPVGDSLTNGKPWLSELHILSANLTTIGTRQGVHEGRSGAGVNTYTNVNGGIVYDYDNAYSDYTIPIFDSSASYSPGDRVRIAHTFGNGSSGYRYWVFKQAHSPGDFIESEAYCYSGGNPFYDYVNGKFSMAFYQSFFEISYDAILLFLGTNGIDLEPETNPNGALGIKNLIELIRVDEPTKPIIVVNTIFRSNQNGIGNQGNTDGYVAQSAYKFNEDKKVLLLAKAVDDFCGNMANVYLCPVGFTHDSKYNFGNNKVQVNPRLSSTDDVFELMPSDSVHPQESGYMQMADEIFSTICAVFGS